MVCVFADDGVHRRAGDAAWLRARERQQRWTGWLNGMLAAAKKDADETQVPLGN
jgi:hypothetical protein